MVYYWYIQCISMLVSIYIWYIPDSHGIQFTGLSDYYYL